MEILPRNVGFVDKLLSTEKPTNTFLIDWTSNQIVGMDAGLPAMRQAVEIILANERFRWQIYNGNMGSELEELTGEDVAYIESEIPRKIQEAFSVDNRILSAEHFIFKELGEGRLLISFEVVTVFGSFSEEVIV